MDFYKRAALVLKIFQKERWPLMDRSLSFAENREIPGRWDMAWEEILWVRMHRPTRW